MGATDMLAELTDRRPIERDVEGSDQYGRMIATCFVHHENLNAALVKARIGNGRYQLVSSTERTLRRLE